MKLKAKKLEWVTGRPLVLLSPKTAKELNVHSNERVSLICKEKKLYAAVNISSDLISNGEVGLSNEVLNFLPVKNGCIIDVLPAETSLGGRLIKKKLSGVRLTDEEIHTIISEISQNNMSESEIAFFVSAEQNNGMSKRELIALTSAMIKTGNKIDFGKRIVADKHCIGGIAGNRTTPLVVAICAAAGLTLPKTSSRAITSAAGTADTIETLACVDFPREELMKIVNKTNACLVWNGSLNLSPSDDKIIFVERLLNLDVEPQLIASIMSKKIAAGSNRVIIDIPYGGGKISNLNAAKELGKKFNMVAKKFGIGLRVVYTIGNQPIGNGIGPILEMFDILEVLQGRGPEDLREKSIYLSAELMTLCGFSNSERLARDILDSGLAYEKFREIINAQNNSNDFDKRVKKLALAKYSKTFVANNDREIKRMDNKRVNMLCRILGAPQTKSAGVYLHKKLGSVKKGDKIITLYSESKEKLADAIKYFNDSEPIVLR